MREEIMFGFPITVIEEGDEAQLQKETGGFILHMCFRVADCVATPYPALAARRYISHCAECAHRIWIDPLSIPKGVIAISKCVRCINPEVGPKLDEALAKIRARRSAE